MKFTGRTWRPPYEADTPIIQLTSGCTYQKCNFCSLYKDEPFCMTSLEQFEEDLDVFFASTFWKKLQSIFGECCISKLEKVAKPRLAAILPAT